MTKALVAVLVFVIALSSSPARAQTFSVSYAGQVSLHTVIGSNLSVLPHFGAFIAGDLEFADLNIGARLTGTSLLFLIWSISADAYVGYTLETGLNVYLGAGVRAWYILLPIASAESLASNELHGLIGVRFPSGWFVELTPGATSRQSCNDQPPVNTGCSSFQTVWTPSVGVNFGLRLRL